VLEKNGLMPQLLSPRFQGCGRGSVVGLERGAAPPPTIFVVAVARHVVAVVEWQGWETPRIPPPPPPQRGESDAESSRWA